MKKLILFLLVAAPLACFAQSEVKAGIVGENGFLQVYVMPRSAMNTLQYKVSYVCNRQSDEVKNEKGKPYTFFNWAEIYEYFDGQGWVYFRDAPVTPEGIYSVQVFRRKK